MKHLKFIMVIMALLVVLTSCSTDKTMQMEESHSMFGSGSAYHLSDHWFDRGGSTKDIECFGGINDGQIICYIVNISTNYIAMNRTECDFTYLLRYFDANGNERQTHESTVIEYHLGRIEILDPTPDHDTWTTSSATEFRCKLPDDCSRVSALSLKIEHITMSQMSLCKDSASLSQLFENNVHYYRVKLR